MKALVIKTGEIFDIKSEHKEFSGSIDKWWNRNIHSPIEIKDYYILSNGKKYCESELIIGMDNIRDSKLEELL